MATKKLLIFPCSVWILGPKLMYLSVLIPATYLGMPLLPDRLYTILPLLFVIGQTQLGCIYRAIHFAAEGMTGVNRFVKFLLLDELEVSASLERSKVRPDSVDCGVCIKDFTAKWDKNVEQNTLDNLNINVEAGKLLAVIGPVGAGKSSLLMSVLGELPASQGKIEVKGQISYAAQQPWVFSASLRQNIVFGQKYDAIKYERIVKACALKKDLDIMPHGDGTLIGDRGISLSGGQRARVSLARALYMDADIYLLDDPLSAVDAEVGRHIFEKVVMGLLMNKSRILVTHQLQYLTVADKILILKEGETMGMGTFDELSQSGVDFSTLLKRDEEEEEPELKRSESHMELMRSLSHSSKHMNELGSALSLQSIDVDYEPDPVQVQQEEEIKEGTVTLSVYKEYFKAGASLAMFILLVLANLIAQTSYVMSDWWLSCWANEEETKHAAQREHDLLVEQGYNVTNVTIPIIDMPRNVLIFTGVTLSVFLFGLMRALLFFKIAITASKTLHNRMFSSILRTNISFFDNNPVGRVLNRFSKDVGHMDDNLPVTFFDFVQCFLLICGIVIVSGVVNPWVFIPVVPLTFAFIAIRHYYIKTSRNIKRLEGTTRSPVFSHLSATLQGLWTIRAFGVQEKFAVEFDNHQDLHSEAWFLFITTSRWLAVRLDWLCALFVTSVVFCSVFASQDLDAGLVGLSVTYSMALMGMFQWAVRQSAEVENQMVSVERVLEYTNLTKEAELESDNDHKPPPSWPQHGIITGDNASLRYAEGAPLVLKHINFCIRAKEKVGIVGRTGAGKSSLLTMLFRLVEPEGKVLIDGINIQNIGLHDLRSKISIIPQDPMLFTGSVRKNLDPFQQHSDAVLWSALEEVQLKSVMEDLPEGLEWLVSEGGINFSVGQRQLICLARAILRKNKILVIDEATANVDPRTDGLIQETIREKFRECTVLTIAHRLHTIMDSDRVLFLDEGKVMELDEPYTLLLNMEGLFYKMVEQTGKAELDNLTTMAHNAFQARTEKREQEKLNDQSNGITAMTEDHPNLEDKRSTAAEAVAPSSEAAIPDEDRLVSDTDALLSTNREPSNIPISMVVSPAGSAQAATTTADDVETGSSEKDKLLQTGSITI